MNKIAVAKFAVRLVTGAGTTTISKSIIQNNVQPDNVIEKISVAFASVVIGSMASEATKSHTDAKIDELVAAWNKSTTSKETPAADPA